VLIVPAGELGMIKLQAADRQQARYQTSLKRLRQAQGFGVVLPARRGPARRATGVSLRSSTRRPRMMRWYKRIPPITARQLGTSRPVIGNQ